ARARDLAQSIPRLRHHHALPRILLRLPQDRPPRLRHHHHPIHAQKGLHRAQIPENVSPRLSRPRHLLRKRRQQNPPRHRRRRPPRLVPPPPRPHPPPPPPPLHLPPLPSPPPPPQPQALPPPPL